MIIKELGLKPYLPVWEEMKEFTAQRTKETPDECWLVEHPPVYTQGVAGKAVHVINSQEIPIVQSDRGGQVTFHGPGQIIAYVLVDLHRLRLGIKGLVNTLEQIIIQLLADYAIPATTRCKAPGVYVEDKKIASIGLRVKNGCTYHGIALNVDMDLSPFQGINPCGFAGLEMTQIRDFVPTVAFQEIQSRLKNVLLERLKK
jgi:lipoyl(octanoyl) transferase